MWHCTFRPNISILGLYIQRTLFQEWSVHMQLCKCKREGDGFLLENLQKSIHIHVSLTVQSRTLQTSVSMVDVNVCHIALGLFAVYLHLDIGMNLLQTSKLLKHLLVSKVVTLADDPLIKSI